jgi:hypothetical protein
VIGSHPRLIHRLFTRIGGRQPLRGNCDLGVPKTFSSVAASAVISTLMLARVAELAVRRRCGFWLFVVLFLGFF